MRLIRRVFWLIVTAFFLLPLSSQAIEKSADHHSVLVSPYHYPIENPWIATFSSAVLAKPPTPFAYKTLPFVLYPDRAKIKTIGDKAEVKVAFFEQEHNSTAPLIFLIPGIGGNARYPKTVYIADLLHRAGFNVITLPATLSSQFTYGISKSGFPGYSPRDAEDMFEFMQMVDSKLRRDENLRPSRYAIMGFSLGALDAGFIAKLDQEKRIFNFERVLMINPPIQKAKSIAALDWLVQQRKGRSIDDLINEDSDLNSEPDLIDYPSGKFEAFPSLGINRPTGPGDSELAWLIGANFRRVLCKVILASQDIYDLNIVRTNSKRHLKSLSRREAIHYSYKDYVDQILFTEINNSTLNDGRAIRFQNTTDLVSTTDLRPVLNDLSLGSPQWAVFHNQNDFIFHEGDLEFLTNAKSSSLVYPRGGHIGNIWYKKNQDDILNFFRPLLY